MIYDPPFTRFLKNENDWKEYCEHIDSWTEAYVKTYHGTPPTEYPCVAMCVSSDSYDSSSGRYTYTNYCHALVYPSEMEVKELLKYMLCQDRSYLAALTTEP